jgi:outer membrane lipoprotein-sorting protein
MINRLSVLRNSLTLAIVIVLGSLIVGSASAVAVTPSLLYRKALTSEAKYSYVGRQFITNYGDDGRSMSYVTQVTHMAPDRFKIVYEAPQQDFDRVIIRCNKEQWTYLPKGSLLIHSEGMMPLSAKQQAAKYALLKHNYYLILDSTTTRIADRKVFKLSITPHNANESVVKLWIDPDTGIVMRKEQYHSDGALDTVMYFSDLSLVKKVNPSAFDISSLAHRRLKIVEQHNPSEIVVRRANVAAYLGRSAPVPEFFGGFELQSLTVLHQPHGWTVHLRYSDGLVSLSLFESKRPSKQASTVPQSRLVQLCPHRNGHAIQRYSYNLLNWDNSNYNFTLVGDEKLKTLTEFSRSIASD